MSLVGRTVVLSLCAALLACLPGCLVPVAYPSFTHVPSVELGKDYDRVYAFRVDVTEKQVDLGESQCDMLTRIPLSTDSTPAQSEIAISHGVFVIGVALNYPILTSHSVAVRLYRPGYELIEVKPGDKVDRADWKAAPGLASQEKALDALCRRIEAQKEEIFMLEPGSAAAAHKGVLLFGASEYDRLAALASASDPAKEEVRARLAGKAQALRALAEK
jgi:hypothetical protein